MSWLLDGVKVAAALVGNFGKVGFGDLAVRVFCLGVCVVGSEPFLGRDGFLDALVGGPAGGQFGGGTVGRCPGGGGVR